MWVILNGFIHQNGGEGGTEEGEPLDFLNGGWARQVGGGVGATTSTLVRHWIHAFNSVVPTFTDGKDVHTHGVQDYRELLKRADLMVPMQL